MLSTFKSLFLKNKKIAAAACVILVAGLAYKFWPAKDAPLPPPMLVEIEVLQAGQLSKTVLLSAVITPKRMTFFHAEEKGIMGPHLVEPGIHVSAGTMLAQLRNLKWQRATEHAQKKAFLEKEQYNRLKKLTASNVKSQRSLEIAYKEWLSAEIAFEKAKLALDRTHFKAPYDGQVGFFKAQEGQALRNGENVLVFYDTSAYVLEIDVPDSLLGLLKAGSSVEAKGLKGTIDSVQKILDPKTHMGIAKATLDTPFNGSTDSPDSDLVLGSRLPVNVTVAKRDKVLTLPRSAVFLKDSKPSVYKIVEGKAELVAITTGLEAQKRLEVLSGLNIGDHIILKGQGGIWPTKDVKAINLDPKSQDEKEAQKATQGEDK